MEPDLLKDGVFLLGTLGLLLCVPYVRHFLVDFYRATSDTKGHLAALQGVSIGLFLLLILYWPLIRAIREWLFSL